MGLKVEDGGGSGYEMKVDKEGRGLVFATSVSQDNHINTESGKVWSLTFDALNPAGNNDYVFYIKNNGEQNIRVTDFRLSASAATRVSVDGVTGTAVGGTALTAVSRTIGGSAIPTATIETGTDITGLTTSGTLFYIECPVADTLYHINTSSNIIIQKGKAMALLVGTGTANLSGVVSIVEEELL